MKLPIWVYDYKLKRYVVFPFHLLTTFPNGKRGFIFDAFNTAQYECLIKYRHLFFQIRISDKPLNNFPLYFAQYKYVLNERGADPSMKKDKGPRWYNRENHKISSVTKELKKRKK